MVEDVSDEEEAEEPTKVNPQPDAKLLETLAAPPGAPLGPPPGAAPRAAGAPAPAAGAPAIGPSSTARRPAIGVPSAARTAGATGAGPAIRPVARPPSAPESSPSTRGLSVPTQAGLGDAANAARAGVPKPPSSSSQSLGRTVPIGTTKPSTSMPASTPDVPKPPASSRPSTPRAGAPSGAMAAASSAGAVPAAPKKEQPALPEVHDSEPPDSGPGGGTLIMTPAQGAPGPHQGAALDQTLAFGAPGAPGGPSPYGSPLGSPAADAAWSTQGANPYPSVQGHVMGQGGAPSQGGLSTLPHGMATPGLPPGYGPPGAPYGAPHVPPSASMPPNFEFGVILPSGPGPAMPPGYVPPTPPSYAHNHGPAPDDSRRVPMGVLVGVGLALVLVAAGVLAYLGLRAPEEPAELPRPAPVETAAPTATAAPPPVVEPPPAVAPAPEPAKAAPAEVPAEAPAPAPSPTTAPAQPARPATPAPMAAPRQVAPAAAPKEVPAADASGWNESLARSRLAQANGVLSFCKKEGGITGKGVALVTFVNDGTVSTVNVDPPFAGTKEGDCAAGQFRRAKVTPFEGPPRVVRHAFEIPK